MFHGGTNFGFTNGANDKGVYQPLVTSYDYDAPLDEAGNPTAKYWAFRDVIAKYVLVSEEKPVVAAPAAEFTATLTQTVSVLTAVDRLGAWTRHDELPTLDALGHYSGFALYTTEIDVTEPAILEFEDVRDRAYVFVNGARIGVLARDHHDRAIALAPSHGTLTILLEDQGRVNYGPRIGEAKGLIGPARLNGELLGGWSILPIDLDSLGAVTAVLDDAPADASGWLAGPAVARGQFTAPDVRDLFLDTSRWGKGVVWINGFCLGRYWSRGPQRTLFVPGPVLTAGENEVVVLELETAATTAVRFVAQAELGHTES